MKPSERAQFPKTCDRCGRLSEWPFHYITEHTTVGYNERLLCLECIERSIYPIRKDNECSQ